MFVFSDDVYVTMQLTYPPVCFDIYIFMPGQTVAYPELVSRGVSKSRKFKWLVKVGAYKDVNPLI